LIDLSITASPFVPMTFLLVLVLLPDERSSDIKC